MNACQVRARRLLEKQSAHCHWTLLLETRHSDAGWVFSDNVVVVNTLARILVFVAVAIVGDGVNAVQVRNERLANAVMQGLAVSAFRITGCFAWSYDALN